MMRTMQKSLFYMSSFIPLYILLIVQNFKFKDTDGKISIDVMLNQFLLKNGAQAIFWYVLFILIISSVVGYCLFFFVYKNKPGNKTKLTDTEFVREDTMGYIVTYLVPLISMDITSYRNLTVNFLLFIIIGTFYVKNDQIFMNPIYNVLGYNVFSTESGIYITKISKHKLKKLSKFESDVRIITIVSDVYILKESESLKKIIFSSKKTLAQAKVFFHHTIFPNNKLFSTIVFTANNNFGAFINFPHKI